MNRIQRKLRNNAIQKQNVKELERIKQTAENSALKIEELIKERKIKVEKINKSFQQQEEPSEDFEKQEREIRELKIA